MHMSDAGGTGDPTETLEMDWSHSLQAKPVISITQQVWTWNPEGTRKENDLETCGAAIWKQTSKKLDTAGDSWRAWLRNGMTGEIMMVAYSPMRDKEGFDWLIMITTTLIWLTADLSLSSLSCALVPWIRARYFREVLRGMARLSKPTAATCQWILCSDLTSLERLLRDSNKDLRPPYYASRKKPIGHHVTW